MSRESNEEDLKRRREAVRRRNVKGFNVTSFSSDDELTEIDLSTATDLEVKRFLATLVNKLK